MALSQSTTQNRRNRASARLCIDDDLKENTPTTTEAKAGSKGRGKGKVAWEYAWDEDNSLKAAATKEDRTPFASANSRTNQRRADVTRSRRRPSLQGKLAASHAAHMVDGNDFAIAPLATPRTFANQLARFEATIVDKGYEAIATIGRTAATIATSLDSAIEQLATALTISGETPSSRGKPSPTPSLSGLHTPRASSPMPATPSTVAADTPPHTGGKDSSTHEVSEQELQKLRKTRYSYGKLKGQYSKLQNQLKAQQVQLEEKTLENERLRSQLMVIPEGDPLSEQVRGQLQVLLAEKARLASENAQLQRANRSLQELLEYSMSQQLDALEYSNDCRELEVNSGGSCEENWGFEGWGEEEGDSLQSDEDTVPDSLFDKVDD